MPKKAKEIDPIIILFKSLLNVKETGPLNLSLYRYLFLIILNLNLWSGLRYLLSFIFFDLKFSKAPN